MKVLYDVSVLGLGHLYPKARTGVFRVVDNVATEIILQRECEVTFCAGSDFDSVINSISYLKTKRELSNIPFSRPEQFEKKLKLREQRSQIIKHVHDESPSLFNKLASRAKLKTIAWEDRFLYQSEQNVINPGDLADTDIYHTPFYSIPEQVLTTGKPVFLTCYDIIAILHPHYFDQYVFDLVHKIVSTITHDTWILCISNATRNDLLNYLGNKVDPAKVVVTQLAASKSFYQNKSEELGKQVRHKYHIPEDEPYVLTLCTLEPRKNIERVIRSFSKLVAQERIQSLNLVLVGVKGWLFDGIFKEIELDQELKKRIIITGYVPDEDLAPLYTEALVFAYPSFYEGFGLPPLEAMQCGTPVITSNTSSLPEVVGDAAIMVSPTDTDALCQAMLDVYNSASLRSKMSEQSLLRAQNFSWRRCAEETVAAYKLAL